MNKIYIMVLGNIIAFMFPNLLVVVMDKTGRDNVLCVLPVNVCFSKNFRVQHFNNQFAVAARISLAVSKTFGVWVLGLLTIITLFVIVSIIINMVSWVDYRQEEVNLLSQEVGSNYRKSPNWKNFWRWNETYFVLFLLLMFVSIYVFTEIWIIPVIR